MEISGKGLLHFYQETSSLIGNQTYHRTNIISPYLSNSCYNSDYMYEGQFYVRKNGLYLYKYRIYGTLTMYILKGLAPGYHLI